MDPTNPSYLITDLHFTMVGKDVFYQGGTDHIIGWNTHQLRTKCTVLYVMHLDTVPGTSGKLDTAFTTVGTQGQRWKKATTLLSKHQSSLVHKQSALSYAEFLTSIPINHQLDQASAKSSSRLQKQQETNREILHRIIDVILLLVKTGHPLRGHRENNESHNRGLFLEITQLLAKYDGLLKAHFEDGPRNARYTSMTIQNYLISAIYHNMISLLKEEFSGIVYFSIMMDEASDLSHKEQVSIVVRYVDSQYVIQERLVDVESTDSTTAEALFQILLKGLSKIGLTTDNLVGQCYDGASNMRGIHAGVQAKVKEIQPRAIYCHCYAHCVNLVLVEATSSNQCCRNFFGVIQNLYTFIEASPHRHSTLVAFMKELSSKPHVKTLKKLSDTRWACRSDAVQAVYENFEAIVKSLEEIEDNCYDGRISAEACGLKFSILKFDFFLCLFVLKDLLFKCRTVSDYLQREDIDIVSALQVVDTTVKTIGDMRNETKFKEYYDKAVEFAREKNVEVLEPRRRKVSRRIDENWQNEYSSSYEESLRVGFYYEVLDIILNEFNYRFNQESRIFLSFLGELQLRKIASDSKFDQIASHFSLDAHFL